MIRIIAASVSSIDMTRGGGHGFEFCLHHTRRLISISRNNISIIHSIYPLIKRRLPAVPCVNDGMSWQPDDLGLNHRTGRTAHGLNARLHCATNRTDVILISLEASILSFWWRSEASKLPVLVSRLFNDAVCSLDYIVSNNRMISY
jgi:hypothetical protein